MTLDSSRDRAKPINYHLSLFDLQLEGSWGYKGLLKIDTKITRSANEIVLNAKDIDVQDAVIFGKDGSYHKLGSW